VKDATLYSLYLLKGLSETPSASQMFDGDRDLAFQVCVVLSDILVGNRFPSQTAADPRPLALLGCRTLKNIVAFPLFKGVLPKLPALNDLVYHLSLLLFGEETASVALTALASIFKACRIRREAVQGALSLLIDTLMGFLNAGNEITSTTSFLSLVSCIAKLHPDGFLSHPHSQVFLEFLIIKSNALLAGVVKPSVASNLSLYILHKLTATSAGMIQFLSLERTKVTSFTIGLAQHLQILTPHGVAKDALTRTIIVEMAFRLASHEIELFSKIPDLPRFFDDLFRVFVKGALSEQQLDDSDEEGEETSADSESLALLLLRLARNDKCRRALLAQKDFDRTFVFLLQHLHVMTLSEAESYSYVLGLLSFTPQPEDLQRIASIIIGNSAIDSGSRSSCLEPEIMFAVVSKIFHIKEIRDAWFIQSNAFTSRMASIVQVVAENKIEGGTPQDVALDKLFDAVGTGLPADSEALPGVLEGYLTVSKGPRGDAGGSPLEVLFFASLRAFQVKDKLEEGLLDCGHTLASLLVQCQAAVSRTTKRNSPTKTKSPSKFRLGEQGADTLEALCAAFLAESRLSAQADLVEFTHLELKMKTFNEGFFLYLFIAHFFALGILSNHILYSDW